MKLGVGSDVRLEDPGYLVFQPYTDGQQLMLGVAAPLAEIAIGSVLGLALGMGSTAGAAGPGTATWLSQSGEILAQSPGRNRVPAVPTGRRSSARPVCREFAESVRFDASSIHPTLYLNERPVLAARYIWRDDEIATLSRNPKLRKANHVMLCDSSVPLERLKSLFEANFFQLTLEP